MKLGEENIKNQRSKIKVTNQISKREGENL